MLWLQSVIVNLALSLFYLIFRQPDLGGHYDTVVLYCVYFATFMLADVTTTNIFGLDIPRTTQALRNNQSFLHILLRKNAVQFTVIVLPVLTLTAGWTEYLYHESQMVRTIPGVLYPMLLFMAIGNVISVVFPVLQAPIRWHVQSWRLWQAQAPLLISYALPFLIFALWLYTDLPGFLNELLRESGSDNFVPQAEAGLLLLLVTYVLYWVLTIAAYVLFQHRGFVFIGQQTLIANAPFPQDIHDAIKYWKQNIH